MNGDGFVTKRFKVDSGDAHFNEIWREIQARLSEDIEIPNWGYEGYTGKVTRIEGKNYDEIIVSGERTTERRRVPRQEFKKVFELWDRYKHDGNRAEIQQISRNSTYIFSILHWLELIVGNE